MIMELIVPGLGVVKDLGSVGVKISGNITQKIDLAIGGGFFEHDEA